MFYDIFSEKKTVPFGTVSNCLKESDCRLSFESFLSENLFYMRYILRRSKRFYDLRMLFMLFQFFLCDGKGDRIYAEAGVNIGRIQLDIINLQPQPPDRSNEILQIMNHPQSQSHQSQ